MIPRKPLTVLDVFTAERGTVDMFAVDAELVAFAAIAEAMRVTPWWQTVPPSSKLWRGEIRTRDGVRYNCNNAQGVIAVAR